MRQPKYTWQDPIVTTADRLLCWAIVHGGFRSAQRLLRLADASWKAMLDANAAAPYDHDHYKRCRRLMTMYIVRLVDNDLAQMVLWFSDEATHKPSLSVKYLAKEAK